MALHLLEILGTKTRLLEKQRYLILWDDIENVLILTRANVQSSLLDLGRSTTH